MPFAAVMLREGKSYRRARFEAGLEALGYSIEKNYRRDPRPDDVVVLWNRSRGHESIAQIYERTNAKVLIAENGYLPGEEKTFALAMSKHNGAGFWPRGENPRFDIPMAPWRQDGEHVLVLMQRGIGSIGVAQPTQWKGGMLARLARMTKRPVRVRMHPGIHGDRRPLEEDLRGAWCCVTWGSGAGIKAIVAGVPVFHAFSQWIGAPGALPLQGADIEAPFVGDRTLLARAVSWAQWTKTEITDGTAFRALLG